MLQVIRVRAKGNHCKVLKGEWLRGEKSNLHFENCTAAGRVEKEVEAARMEEKSPARNDCCPGKRGWWLRPGLWWERERSGWTQERFKR